jgi:hypothetical protein
MLGRTGVESGIAEYFGGGGIVLVQVGQKHFLAGTDAAGNGLTDLAGAERCRLVRGGSGL